MERTRPPQYLPLYLAAIAMYVTGITGALHALRAEAAPPPVGELAWILAGALMTLAADTREGPTRGRLWGFYVLSGATIVTCFAARLMALP